MYKNTQMGVATVEMFLFLTNIPSRCLALSPPQRFRGYVGQYLSQWPFKKALSVTFREDTGLLISLGAGCHLSPAISQLIHTNVGRSPLQSNVPRRRVKRSTTASLSHRSHTPDHRTEPPRVHHHTASPPTPPPHTTGRCTCGQSAAAASRRERHTSTRHHRWRPTDTGGSPEMVSRDGVLPRVEMLRRYKC